MTKRQIRKILNQSIRVFNRLDPNKGYREWVASLPGPHGTPSEMKERAREWYTQKLKTLPPNYELHAWMNVVDLLAAFASSIQEELKQKHEAELKYFGGLHRKEYDRISERAEKAEQQLAEARAQVDSLMKLIREWPCGCFSSTQNNWHHDKCLKVRAADVADWA